MQRLTLAMLILCGCAPDDGAPSAAEQRELDAAEAMLDEPPAKNAPDATPDRSN